LCKRCSARLGRQQQFNSLLIAWSPAHVFLRAGALALRLMLVLRFVDASPRGQGPVHWKDWLRDDEHGVELQPIVLMRERLGARDVVVALGVLLVVLSWSLS